MKLELLFHKLMRISQVKTKNVGDYQNKILSNKI